MNKKITALLLSFIMFITPIPVFALGESGEDYIPLRSAAEGSGAKVEYNEGIIDIIYKGIIYTYDTKEQKAYKNSEEIELSQPIIIKDGVSYIDYDDVQYLFINPVSKYKDTIKAATIYSYALMEAYDTPGIVISLYDKDSDSEYAWARGYGHSDIENNIYMNGDTTLSIASISKVITTISIFQLIEEGKLNLDDKVIDYLPELDIKPHPVYGGDYKDITIRMLLAHVSGVPSDNFNNFYSVNNYNKEYMNDFINNINLEFMDNKPETRWSYANNGYVLLGIIVSRLSGGTNNFDGFVKYTDKVFKDMNMNDSGFLLNNNIKSKLASSYPMASVNKEKDLLVNSLPAGSAYSSAKDMINLMKTLINKGEYKNKQILSSKSVEEMVSSSGYDMSYSGGIDMGLGLYTVDYLGLPVTGHGGDLAYFHSNMAISTENGLGVFVSGNSSTSVVTSSSLSYLVLQAAVEEKTGKEQGAPIQITTVNKDISRDELKKYEGYYTGAGKVSVTDNNTLYIKNFDMEFNYQDNGSFMNPMLGRLYFEKINGKDIIFFGDTKQTILGERINPKPVDDSFEKWIGNYISVSEKENTVPIIPLIKLDINEDNLSTLSFYVNDGTGVEGMVLGYIEDGMYYILGESRNHGKVIEVYQKDGKSYLKMAGVVYERQE